MAMTRRGLPVPPGFVLTVRFFEPWLARVQDTPEWADVLSSTPGDLAARCEAVQALCLELRLDGEQRAALDGALGALPAGSEPRLFAVRSSSPEEDLEGASFAGGYETVLGVQAERLEDAVRRCFGSAFGERVFLYKQEHGLAVDSPRIAVIVQQQIAAEVAGVAFSLNPVNNSYDEAVINANYGLGESVGAGHVSPDQYVVDKARQAILERKAGKKETSVWLGAAGGTYDQPSPARDRLCLGDEQVLELAGLVAQVERHYAQPMDVEWAFAGGSLYLLQARPITTYVPLPPALLTPPGAPRHLYIDMTLTKWGMPRPLSAMGTNYIDLGNIAILRATMGDVPAEVARQLRPILQGRAYVDASISLKMQGKKRVAAETGTMDALAGEIIANLDEAEYALEKLPPGFQGLIFTILRQNLGLVTHLIRVLRSPQQAQQRYLESVRRLPGDLAAIAQNASSIKALAEALTDRMLADTSLFLAIIFAAEIAKRRIRRLFRSSPPQVRERAAFLERGLPNNVTVEMGLAMDRLAGFNDIVTCASGEQFAARLQARNFSAEFLQAWDGYMVQHGFRCPMEMDPATPRPYEQPALFFERLRLMAGGAGTAPSAQAAHEQVVAQREQAYAELLQLVRQRGRRQARQLESSYRILINLGGLRETPKYSAILATDQFRRRVLQVAQALVEAGRLDNVQQVFDLLLADVDRALLHSALDLRALAEENTRFLRKLDRVREFPRLIDSRGKILHPPRKPATAGELVGEPISPGVVCGPVRVLHTPGEKPLLPGDILVTQATDPGWTPLFLRVGGVLLEVGGLLQHGALVAREYGKPCVAGIEHVTSLLHDGQIVELDGTSGTVRLVGGAEVG
jgi:pyruvate,water dikinase